MSAESQSHIDKVRYVQHEVGGFMYSAILYNHFNWTEIDLYW